MIAARSASWTTEPNPVAIAVVGHDAFVVEAVCSALGDQAVQLVDVAELVAGSRAGAVALLVEADATVWRAVEAAGAPVVVLVNGEPSVGEVVGWVRRGAAGVVTARATAAAIVDSCREVAHGNSVFTPAQARAMAEALHSTPVQPHELSRRELDVLRAIVDGLTVKQTATRLQISPRTVDNVQRFLFRKLDARNRAQAISRAHEYGLLTAKDGD